METHWFWDYIVAPAIRAVVFGVVIVLVFVGASRILGDQQQRTLEDINNGTRATVCVLALPVDGEHGRNQALVEACLRVNGLEP